MRTSRVCFSGSPTPCLTAPGLTLRNTNVTARRSRTSLRACFLFLLHFDAFLTDLHRFGDFFDTPERDGAAPQALGFHGFFKGSYSYHFHNFWCVPNNTLTIHTPYPCNFRQVEAV